MHFLSSDQVQTIADQPSPHEVAASEVVWSGRIVDMVEDHVVVVKGQDPVVRLVQLPSWRCAVRRALRRF